MNLHQLKNLLAWTSIRNKEPVFDEAFELLKQHDFGWSCALVQKLFELSSHPPNLIAADFAEAVLPIWESSEFAFEHPEHQSAPRKAIEAARKGDAEEAKKAANAARSAVQSAVWSAAYAAHAAADAAWSAAWSAANAARSAAYAADAAANAAWSAANAAWSAADIKKRQIEICLGWLK